jgi:hypothetical protein
MFGRAEPLGRSAGRPCPIRPAAPEAVRFYGTSWLRSGIGGKVAPLRHIGGFGGCRNRRIRERLRGYLHARILREVPSFTYLKQCERRSLRSPFLVDWRAPDSVGSHVGWNDASPVFSEARVPGSVPLQPGAKGSAPSRIKWTPLEIRVCRRSSDTYRSRASVLACSRFRSP